MIPKDCKRLAEVDFPIAEVSRHAAREKSIRHGHPSTLHLWWARRPLASSRAVLLGLLWPDPCDPLCPEEFKRRARSLLPQVQGQVGPTDEDLRRKLLKFIGDFANWNLAAHRSYLEVSRALVKAAHGEEPPLVVDPFAGGGSIPLEALRLGCEAFASDLNPVACLILKVMLEDIPRHGPELAEQLRRVGAEIKKQAEQELADFYPKDPDGATPIAYLWARTVRCESPNCGAEIPIYKSAWLSKKSAKNARYFKEAPDGRCRVLLLVSNPLGGPVEFRIARGEGSARLEREATTGQIIQLELFSNIEQGAAPAIRGRGRGRRASVHVSDESRQAARQATTLDRVHAAMLLQAGGRTNALRALLKAEQERGPEFLRLANALSALYPKGSEEKRLLDAMLLAVPR